MHTFNYARPASVAAATAAKAGSADGRYLAGGMTLLPTMKLRLAQPADIVDLNAISELRGIAVQGDRVAVGAMTRHVEVEDSADVRGRVPALARLAAGIGDPQVRNCGTIGGSLANSDPAADYPAAVLALDATLHTSSRAIAADAYFRGLFTTALEPNELLVRVEFRIPRRAGYVKFPNPASRYAMVGVFVADYGDRVRVGVTGAGPCAFRLPAFEAALAQRFAPEALAALTVAADALNSDLHGSAEYRAHLTRVMAQRAVAQAVAGR